MDAQAFGCVFTIILLTRVGKCKIQVVEKMKTLVLLLLTHNLD